MSDTAEVKGPPGGRKDAPSAYRMEQAMSALLAVRARLLEEDPDLAADERLLADMLDGETAEGTMEVLHRMVRAAVHADDMADACDRRAKETAERKRRWAARRDGLRAAVFAAVDALGMKRLDMPECTVSVAAGRQGVVIVNEEKVPEQYIRTKREPERAVILADLKAGVTVPGCVLANGTPSLTVRTK